MDNHDFSKSKRYLQIIFIVFIEINNEMESFLQLKFAILSLQRLQLKVVL